MINKYLPLIWIAYVVTFAMDITFLFLGIYESCTYFIGLGVFAGIQAIIGSLILWDSMKNYSAESTTVMIATGFIPFAQPMGMYFAHRFKRGN